MKRRNFFKVLGAAVVAPTAVKAAPKRDGEGWGRITPYKHSDPVYTSYERYAGYEPINRDWAEIIRQQNAVIQAMAKRKA